MHRELKEKAIRLRLDKQLSYLAIQRELAVAKSTLSEWLRPFPLSKEKILELKQLAWKKNEVKIEMFRASMRGKREAKDREVYETYLNQFQKVSREVVFTSGLVLYLAEGSKTDNYTASLANTDPRVIKFFIKWLCNFFRVPRTKLRAHLHLYENMDIARETEFWKNELGFKISQFYKPYITKCKESSFLYKESFRHGTCSIKVSDTKLKRNIMMAIRAYLDSVLSKY